MSYDSQLSVLDKQLETMKTHYYTRKGKHDQLMHQKSVLEEQLQKVIANIKMFEQVRILLQKTSELAREQSKKQVETLVTNCLQYIFNTNIHFEIDIAESRGRSEAEFYVVSDIDGELIKNKPQNARGGGVVDIVSLALRIAILQSSIPKIDGPIILDEPAKHVSEEYINSVAEFLKQVNIMFGRQIIMVTHNRHLGESADKVLRVELEGDKSRVAIDS